MRFWGFRCLGEWVYADKYTYHSQPRRESTNKQHVGRGGGGNVFKPSKEELETAKREGGDSAIADDEPQKKGGLLDKAKELFGGKKSGEEKR